MEPKTRTPYALYLDVFAFVAASGQGSAVDLADPSEDQLVAIALGVADGIQARAVAGRPEPGAASITPPSDTIRTKSDLLSEVAQRLGPTPAS